MAKLSELIPTLARVLPMPEKTVAMYARHLREAHLVSTGGRGPGAAQMTATDCARLLIAIMAADQVKDAVSAVETFWPLELEEINTRHSLPEAMKEDWATLPDTILDTMMPDGAEEQSFGETVAALIDAVRLGTLTQTMAELQDAHLRVEIERRFHTAKIYFQHDGDGKGYAQLAMLARFYLPEGPERKRIEAESYISGGDAMISFAVTHHTINNLGLLIRN
ncbi:hypothetical protein C2I36_15365 [Rhodobacteraceae bacterium WD3A24]|nr:hypothetical protein C2I36_15365 [Rhodobacteraceae bacterium WD3A24]